MAYTVEIGKTAAKELEAVPQVERAAIQKKIDDLANDPRPSGCKKLKGRSDGFRIRQGNYRVIYAVEDKVKVVKVEKVGHRKDIYD